MSEEPKEQTGVVRDSQGRYVKGHSGNLEGMPAFSEEKLLKRKAKKQYISEYVDKLAEALPDINPVLLKKAKEGDLVAIKEVHDRVMGKAPQSIEHDVEINLYNWNKYEGGQNIDAKDKKKMWDMW